VGADPWSALLATRRARWEVAKVVNELLGRVRHPARVSAGTVSWVVRSGTGAGVVVDTVSALWDAVLSVRPIDATALPKAPAGGPVETAVLEAAAARAASRSAP
jgi:hypothetical protein